MLVQRQMNRLIIKIEIVSITSNRFHSYYSILEQFSSSYCVIDVSSLTDELSLELSAIFQINSSHSTQY